MNSLSTRLFFHNQWYTVRENKKRAVGSSRACLVIVGMEVRVRERERERESNDNRGFTLEVNSNTIYFFFFWGSPRTEGWKTCKRKRERERKKESEGCE